MNPQDLIAGAWIAWFVAVAAGATYNLYNAWCYFVAALRSRRLTVRYYGGGSLGVSFFLLSAALCGVAIGITVLVPREDPAWRGAAALAFQVSLILLALNTGLAVLADFWTRRTIDRLAPEEDGITHGS